MNQLAVSDVRLSWKPWTWARSVHDRAVVNARSASTECSRGRVEREEVALYLATHASAPAVVKRHLA